MEWKPNFKRSKSPRKQRNYLELAPLHVKSKMLKSHLSKDLQKKHNTRSARVKKGDKVKIMRGMYKGKIGLVDLVNVKKQRVYVQGAETIKKDGSKSFHPIHPSNLLIQELKSGDKKRFKEKK
ncbi:50S ribosomal protein L24 [Candidatus Woesearchaeota archaeon CG10_big_fil_rev_8_21_14_0_10_30_7]|nr:MAG: 50S ribosomal protein L24 [Candidatus Woesearchaeota archaeon CG10_big_fil_rev_8_21_14_0_10_30_7]